MIAATFSALLLFLSFMAAFKFLFLEISTVYNISFVGILLFSLLRKKDIYQLMPIILISLLLITMIERITQSIKFGSLFEPLNIIVSLILFNIFTIFTCLFLRKWVTKTSFLKRLTYRTNLSVYISWAGLAIYLISILFSKIIIERQNILSETYFTNPENQMNLFVMIVLLSVLIFLIFSMRERRQKDLYLEKIVQQEQLLAYIDTLEATQRDLRHFRHDLKNILLGFSGYLDENDLTGLKSYFYEHVMPKSKDMDMYRLNFSDLNQMKIVELRGLLLTKLITAENRQLHVSLEIVEPVSKFRMTTLDACRCLGIILDNAIEAAILSEDRLVQIAFIQESHGCIVVIQNTTEANVQPFHLFFQEGFSTKGENRGLGLSSVLKIVGEYEDTSFHMKQKETLVIQKLDM